MIWLLWLIPSTIVAVMYGVHYIKNGLHVELSITYNHLVDCLLVSVIFGLLWPFTVWALFDKEDIK